MKFVRTLTINALSKDNMKFDALTIQKQDFGEIIESEGNAPMFSVRKKE